MPVILGLKETEERYYLLVKEPKRFREASMNCKLRGGSLAMPKTTDTNRLMADYVSRAGLTRVYIGVQAQSKDTNGTSSYVYADSSPLQGFAAWSQDEVLNSSLPSTTNSSCVELLSTGTWGHVECEASMFFICEFPKSRRRGGRTGNCPHPLTSQHIAQFNCTVSLKSRAPHPPPPHTALQNNPPLKRSSFSLQILGVLLNQVMGTSGTNQISVQTIASSSTSENHLSFGPMLTLYPISTSWKRDMGASLRSVNAAQVFQGVAPAPVRPVCGSRRRRRCRRRRWRTHDSGGISLRCSRPLCSGVS
ncbi:unnamed protein product [Pleuronectes platessa]|uniref:C-type lectin domain-containing protein n=1 Tax=Pleuronectes platessa TaxID=8262 RepID=A0A9N7YWM2_PLEPL|nr:unnamed protein product [Pleuronectes platessa]